MPDSRPALSADHAVRHSALDTDLNRALFDGFHQHCDDEDVLKTHLFEGRYENIYLDQHHIPRLRELVDEAVGLAEELLDVEGLSAGYWFNHMPSGAVTLPHRHDDDDELLSGVYYIHTPKDSGRLILRGDEDRVITPQASMYVFFAPDVVHEVTRNESGEDRLSIGFNFGIRNGETD